MVTKKKSEEAAAEVTVSETALRNQLRNQASREILDAHRADFDSKLEALYTKNGLTYRKRLTQEQRQEQKNQEKSAKAKAKLDALLAEHPELLQVLPGQSTIEDLQNTGGAGE